MLSCLMIKSMSVLSQIKRVNNLMHINSQLAYKSGLEKWRNRGCERQSLAIATVDAGLPVVGRVFVCPCAVTSEPDDSRNE